jgi:hypothetical protein
MDGWMDEPITSQEPEVTVAGRGRPQREPYAGGSI